MPMGKAWIYLFSTLSSYGWIVGQTEFFSLGSATSLREEKLYLA